MAAPILVSNWIASPPSWIEVRQSIPVLDPTMENLDAGEEEAIALALELHADLLLMDDRKGVLAARRKGIEVTGTLGVLARASSASLSI